MTNEEKQNDMIFKIWGQRTNKFSNNTININGNQYLYNQSYHPETSSVQKNACALVPYHDPLSGSFFSETTDSFLDLLKTSLWIRWMNFTAFLVKKYKVRKEKWPYAFQDIPRERVVVVVVVVVVDGVGVSLSLNPRDMACGKIPVNTRKRKSNYSNYTGNLAVKLTLNLRGRSQAVPAVNFSICILMLCCRFVYYFGSVCSTRYWLC